ncbi:hypothetical protein ACOSQ2_007388 [Xanthoceras sorbifolium]
MCFGYFLNIHEIVFSAQFCHQILLKECHAGDAENKMWFLVGGNRIRFSANEFCLVNGLLFADTVICTKNTKKNKVDKIRWKYFNRAKKVTGLNL